MTDPLTNVAASSNPVESNEIIEYQICETKNGLVGSTYWFYVRDVASTANAMIVREPRMSGLNEVARWASLPHVARQVPVKMRFNEIAFDLIKSGKGYVNCPKCFKTYGASEMVGGAKQIGGYLYETYSCPAQHELINLWVMHLMLRR